MFLCLDLVPLTTDQRSITNGTGFDMSSFSVIETLSHVRFGVSSREGLEGESAFRTGIEEIFLSLMSGNGNGRRVVLNRFFLSRLKLRLYLRLRYLRRSRFYQSRR